MRFWLFHQCHFHQTGENIPIQATIRSVIGCSSAYFVKRVFLNICGDSSMNVLNVKIIQSRTKVFFRCKYPVNLLRMSHSSVVSSGVYNKCYQSKYLESLRYSNGSMNVKWNSSNNLPGPEYPLNWMKNHLDGDNQMYQGLNARLSAPVQVYLPWGWRNAFTASASTHWQTQCNHHIPACISEHRAIDQLEARHANGCSMLSGRAQVPSLACTSPSGDLWGFTTGFRVCIPKMLDQLKI